MDAILKWLTEQLHSAKFWAFVGSVVTIASSYFTGSVDPDTSLKALIAAVLAWLGLGISDAVRHAVLK